MAHVEHGLRIVDWRAVVPGVAAGSDPRLAPEPDLTAAPVQMRRRTPAFELSALCCALPIMTPDSDLVFCSRYGNQTSSTDMLQTLAQADLLSPTLFSLSVHNAAPSLVSQAAGVRESHTAIAAGQGSFAAGAVEAYLRLATAEARSVVLLYADMPLPEFYAELDHETASGLFLALKLELGFAANGIKIEAGRAGALGVLQGLLAKGDTLLVRPADIEALAA